MITSKPPQESETPTTPFTTRVTRRLLAALVLASLVAGCSGGGGALFGPGGQLSQIAHAIDPTPTPAGTPLLGTVVPIAQATGATTYPLQSASGYIGTVTFGTPLAIASGVSVVLTSGVSSAPSPQAAEHHALAASGPSLLANWQMGFSGWSGAINGSFSALPSVTLSLLNPLNLVVEIVDSTAQNSPPAVLYPQAVTVNGLVTFASLTQNQVSTFLYNHVYWIELVQNSALPTPSPSPSAVSS